MRKAVTILWAIVALSICSTTLAKLTPNLHNNFVGVSGAALENIQTRLKLVQESLTENTPLTVADIKELYNNAPKEINKALQPYGYFKTTITPTIKRTGFRWDATYYIQLGEPLRITKLNIKLSGAAARDPKFIKLLQHFPLRQGAIFTTANYKRAKERLFNLAHNRGYLKANMQQSVVAISLATYTSTVVIHFNSGPRYKFGATIFPHTKLESNFLGKMLTYSPGDNYSRSKIIKTQQNFHDSNLFRNVVIEPQLKKIKGQYVPVLVHLTPRKNIEYTIGAGYGTDTKIRGSLGLQVNNIGSRGQHLTGHVQASQREYNFEAHYIIPGNNPAINQYDISAGSKVENYEYGDGVLVKAGPGYTTIIGHGWQQILRVDALAESWEFDDSDKGRQEALVLVPSAMWLKSKSNNSIRPTRGYRISALIQGVPFGMLADRLSFAQAKVSAKLLYPIPRGPLLVLRGTVGYTAVEANQRDNLPMSFWFSAGGAQSVRGYRYQDIGPGTDLVTASVELRQRIHNNWYMAVFLDAGNSADNFGDTLKDTHTGAGIGIVWLSPIGSVQLSFARPMDDMTKRGVVQFSMGPEL